MIYIVLLRGVNVGGKNKILMKDFVNVLLLNPDITNVKSYIQSGNFVVESNLKNTTAINTLFYHTILKTYQYDISIFSYILDDFKFISKNYPFNIKDKKNYITFLQKKITNEEINNIKDEFKIEKDIIYIKYATKYSDSKLNNNYIEKQLNTIATTRNFKTIQKLIDLATN